MVGVDDEHELVFVERRRLDLWMAERAPEADLHLLLQDEVEDLLGVAGADGELQPRMRAAEAGEDPRENVGAHRRRGAERELAALPALELFDHALARSGRAERPFRVGEKGATRVGKPHAAACADEELRSDLLLEALQPRCQRRLRHEERLGRAADAPTLGDVHERL